MNLSAVHLRYLYAIYEISQTTPDVSSTSIAKKMKVSRPSVARMLANLMDRGLLVKKLYGKIYLTDRGFLLACDFDRKIRLLAERFPRMGFSLSEEATLRAARAAAAVLLEEKLDGEQCGEEDGRAPSGKRAKVKTHAALSNSASAPDRTR